MKSFVYFFSFCFLASLLFLAPSAKAQGTLTAASCNQSDVNAIINGPTHTAVNGDTIQIPPGSCTWTSGITVPRGIGITIIGSGTPNSDPGTRAASASCSSVVLTDNLSSGAMITMSPTYGNTTTRLSCVEFLPHLPSSGYSNPVVVNGTCIVSGCPNLRLDNITVPNSWSQGGLPDGSFAFISNVFGVADHNTVGDVKPTSNYLDFLNVGHGSWQGVGSWGDSSWASPDTFGTNQTFYLENNTFIWAQATDSDISNANGGGARFACRFNDFNPLYIFGGCTGHGTDTTGRPRGVRQWEAYKNTGSCADTSQGCNSFSPGRSGVGMSFENTFTNIGSGFFKGIANLDSQRRWRPGAPWGQCAGTSPWDSNDGTVYYSGTVGAVVKGAPSSSYVITDIGNPAWTTNNLIPGGAPYSFWNVTSGNGFEIIANGTNTITVFDGAFGGAFGIHVPAPGDQYQILRSSACIDQPSRAGGLLVTGDWNNPVLVSTGSRGSVNQAVDPTYEAADSMPGTGDHTISSNSLSLIANRDYYAESVNQSAQTSPTSPFNGTSGTGHGTLANRPTTCTKGVGYWATDQGNWNQSGSGGQGELFVCAASNTWTLNYTPYIYPHPLIAGGATGGKIPDPPTTLKATVQ